MANTTYTLNWSDPTLKQSFTVAPGTTNTSNTSLTLFGQGLTPYGQYLLNDMLSMLENFCNTTPPLNPTYGQLWYNPNTHKIKVYDITNEWINSSGITTTQPANPTLGELWFNTSNDTLNYWDGSNWQQIVDAAVLNAQLSSAVNTLNNALAAETAAREAADTNLMNLKVNRAGDTMTGTLTINGQLIAQNQFGAYIDFGGTAAQPGYEINLANSAYPLFVWSPTGPINVDILGRMTSTQVTINDNPVNPTDGVNKEYVDAGLANTINQMTSGYLPITGGTLTGPLILSANPLQPLQSATKQYVDNSNFAKGAVYVGTFSINFAVASTYFEPAQVNIDLTAWYDDYVSNIGSIPVYQFVVVPIMSISYIGMSAKSAYSQAIDYQNILNGYMNNGSYDSSLTTSDVISNAIAAIDGQGFNGNIVPYQLQLLMGPFGNQHAYSTSGLTCTARVTLMAGSAETVFKAMPITIGSGQAVGTIGFGNTGYMSYNIEGNV